MIKIAQKSIGRGQPCFVVAEIGINHNGDIDIAKKLIDAAVEAGCDAVKFQKRTIDIVYTQEELAMPRPNHFGDTNGDLKRGLEFGYDEYSEIDRYCKEKGIIWFASCWDKEAVDFIDQFAPPCYKIASACLTDDKLLKHTAAKGKPILLSTGMSTLSEISHAVGVIKGFGVSDNHIFMYHCTSTYPTDLSELNLEFIRAGRDKDLDFGYSGHEKGIMASIIAVALGAVSIERHVTLDKNMWGSDQAASIDPQELKDMVSVIRQIPIMLGDGKKVVYESEKPIISKLRRN